MEVGMVKSGQKYCELGFHAWQRELQTIDGEECVVRKCRQCGATEICWFPRKRPLERQAALTSGCERSR
jgi:hypothetical protein